VREKYYSCWKNKLKSTNYKTSEQDHYKKTFIIQEEYMVTRGMCQYFFVVVITILQVSFCFWWPFGVSRSYWSELALLCGLNIPCFCGGLSVQFILAVVCYLPQPSGLSHCDGDVPPKSEGIGLSFFRGPVHFFSISFCLIFNMFNSANTLGQHNINSLENGNSGLERFR